MSDMSWVGCRGYRAEREREREKERERGGGGGYREIYA